MAQGLVLLSYPGTPIKRYALKYALDWILSVNTLGLSFFIMSVQQLNEFFFNRIQILRWLVSNPGHPEMELTATANGAFKNWLPYPTFDPCKIYV